MVSRPDVLRCALGQRRGACAHSLGSLVRFWVLLLGGVGVLAAAEVELSISSPATAGVAVLGEVRFIDLDQDIERYELPEGPGYRLRLLTNQRGSKTEIHGHQRRVIRWYQLEARFDQPGRYDLAPARFVQRDGTVLTTAPLTVEVIAPRDDLRGNCVAEVSFAPQRIVPGEACTMTYRVHLNQSQYQLDIQDIDGALLPEGAIELGETRSEQGVVHDTQGQAWIVRSFHRRFTMTEPGTYRVGGQQRYGAKVRAFIGTEFQSIGTVAVKPDHVVVEALPQSGRPDDFAGLVGEATLSAQLERDRIATGEGTRLTLTVHSRQADLLNHLDLPPIEGLQVYARDHDDTAEGARQFSWDLVPQRPGEYRIPALSVPWFDPSSRSYRRALSDPLHLSVLPGRGGGVQVVGQGAALDTESPVYDGPQLPAPRHQDPATPAPAGWQMLLGGLLLGGAVGLGGRLRGRQRRGVHPVDQLAQALRSGDLAQANDLLSRYRMQLTDPERLARADRLLAAIEDARFGGGQLPPDAIPRAGELR